MKAWRRIGVLGLLLACAVPARAETVTLRHKFVPNDLTAYHVEMSGQGTVGISGISNQGQIVVPLQGGITMDTRQRVLGVRPDGTATLRNVLDLIVMSGAATFQGQNMTMDMAMNANGMRMRMNGQEMQQPPGAAQQMKKMNVLGKPFLTRMDPRGRVVAMALPNLPMFKQALPGVDLSKFLQPGQGSQFLLPEKPVSVGETWQNTVKMPMPGLPTPIEVQTVSQLVGLEQDSAGHSIARIQQTMSLNVENLALNVAPPGKAGPPMSLTFERLRETMSGPVLWSVDEGKLVRMDTELSVDLAMSMPPVMLAAQGNSQPSRMQFVATLQGRISVVRK